MASKKSLGIKKLNKIKLGYFYVILPKWGLVGDGFR